MTTLRSRVFIFISLGVLLFLAVAIAIMVFNKKAAPTDETAVIPPTGVIDQANFPAQITTQPTQIPTGVSVKPLTTEEMQKNAAKQMARIFVERYATYSSDNEGENIREVESLVTTELWTEISKRLGVPAVGMFIGVTTKVFAIDVTEFGAGRAKVEINTQREITKDIAVEKKNERVNVWLIKVGETWLVEKFEWVKM